ncbi:MAG: MBL fold metallo-hydrolase [Chloroflexota bacterium]
MEMKEVAERIYLIKMPISAAQGVLSAYVIRGESGVLIDPGPASVVPGVLEGMKQLGVKELEYIIPTHIHLDHAGGMGKLAGIFPQARFVLHPAAVKHAVDPTRLIEGTKMAFGADFEKAWGAILPVPEGRITVPKDGEILSTRCGELKVIYAPGHAPHHIAILDERTGGLFCGEALGVPKSGAELFPLPSVAPPSFDIEVYLETMGKLCQLKPRTLFYAHDGVGREPEKLIPVAEENTRTFADIILRALKEGKSPEEIGSRLNEYILSRVQVGADEMDRTMTVDAYTGYFKKKGMV